MIAMLTGKVDRTGEGFIIIDVNGVGYLVFCSSRTLSYLADKFGEISINIETHVREDHIHIHTKVLLRLDIFSAIVVTWRPQTTIFCN